MDVRIEQTWKTALKDEFIKPYFHDLTAFVKKMYRQTRVYPPPKLIFNAFDLCPFNTVRVVILGQDPYHSFSQAHGLCFSVMSGTPIPPSLKNIYKEFRNFKF